MARDAQLSGDRVNTEYYLQFADHYFRVLADQRGRFEEQNQSRRPRDDFDIDDDFGYENETVRAEEQQPRGEDNRREDRNNGGRDRDRRFNRRDEQRGLESEQAAEEAPAAPVPAPAAEAVAETVEEAPRPRRGRPRRVPEAEAGAAAIDADRLPPSLGAVPPEGVIASEGEPIEAPRPRTRRRRTADAEASAS